MLKARGLDFADAGLVFEGPTFTFEDARVDYGAMLGLLRGTVVLIVHAEPRRTSCDFHA